MPRSGWLAIGTTVACLLGATLEARAGPVLLIIAVGLVASAVAIRRGTDRPALAVALGIAAVATEGNGWSSRSGRAPRVSCVMREEFLRALQSQLRLLLAHARQRPQHRFEHLREHR